MSVQDTIEREIRIDKHMRDKEGTITQRGARVEATR